MAGLAAVSALAAFRAQQDEINRLRLRESEEDKRNSHTDFERAFFQLLEFHRSIVNSIDVVSPTSSTTGQDAFRSMLLLFAKNMSTGSQESWKYTYKRHENDLGHYFRFLYHIVSFVDQKEIDDQYFYVRLLRATLSQSELILIALNCAFGEGKEKFQPLIEKYAFLHNISQPNRQQYSLSGHFSSKAFDYAP
jgi:hypothetical protein